MGQWKSDSSKCYKVFLFCISIFTNSALASLIYLLLVDETTEIQKKNRINNEKRKNEFCPTETMANMQMYLIFFFVHLPFYDCFILIIWSQTE